MYCKCLKIEMNEATTMYLVFEVYRTYALILFYSRYAITKLGCYYGNDLIDRLPCEDALVPAELAEVT